MLGLDKIAKMLAFFAIFNAIILAILGIFASIIKLFVSFIQQITEGDGTAFGFMMAAIYIMLIILLILLIRFRHKVKDSVTKFSNKINKNVGGRLMRAADKPMKAASKASKIADPAMMRKMAYAAKYTGNRNLTKSLYRAATTSELLKRTTEIYDSKLRGDIEKNKDNIKKYAYNKDGKTTFGKDGMKDSHFVDREGNVVTDNDKIAELKSMKHLLMNTDKYGNLYDPVTGKLLTGDTKYLPKESNKEVNPYEEMLTDEEVLSNLDSLEAKNNQLPEDLALRRKMLYDRKVATEYLDNFNRYVNYGNDKGVVSSQLFNHEGARSLFDSNAEAYARILNNSYTDEDLDSIAGYRINGQKHILVPEFEEDDNGVRVVSGLTEMAVKTREDGDGKFLETITDNKQLAKIIKADNASLNKAAESQSGLPENVVNKYNAEDINELNDVQRSAEAHTQSTRGQTFPMDVEYPEDIDESTRDRLNQHGLDVINEEASADYNPDNSDFISDDIYYTPDELRYLDEQRLADIEAQEASYAHQIDPYDTQAESDELRRTLFNDEYNQPENHPEEIARNVPDQQANVRRESGLDNPYQQGLPADVSNPYSSGVNDSYDPTVSNPYDRGGIIDTQNMRNDLEGVYKDNIQLEQQLNDMRSGKQEAMQNMRNTYEQFYGDSNLAGISDEQVEAKMLSFYESMKNPEEFTKLDQNPRFMDENGVSFASRMQQLGNDWERMHIGSREAADRLSNNNARISEMRDRFVSDGVNASKDDSSTEDLKDKMNQVKESRESLFNEIQQELQQQILDQTEEERKKRELEELGEEEINATNDGKFDPRQREW